jgi:hypothetical protein
MSSVTIAPVISLDARRVDAEKRRVHRAEVDAALARRGILPPAR